MEIRRMKIEEVNDVSRIYARSWKAAYRGIVPQDYLDGLPELRWTALLAENPSKSYVLIDGGRLAGTSSISPARDEKMAGWGEIISLYLLPEYFGRGHGRALLDFCVNELRAAGYAHIYLWTLEKNTVARTFYEKAGFKHDGEKITCSIGGESLTEVRYIYLINGAETVCDG